MLKKAAFVLLVVLIVGLAGCATARYEKPNATATIKGMYCDLCVRAIKYSLLEVPGITQATVSFSQKKAFMVIDETVTDEQIVEAIEEAGGPGEYTVLRIVHR